MEVIVCSSTHPDQALTLVDGGGTTLDEALRAVGELHGIDAAKASLRLVSEEGVATGDDGGAPLESYFPVIPGMRITAEVPYKHIARAKLGERGCLEDPDAHFARALCAKDVETMRLFYTSELVKRDHPTVAAAVLDIDMLTAALDAGADPNTKDATGHKTLLHAAVEYRKLPTIELLLSRGADPEMPTSSPAIGAEEFNALHIAVHKGYTDVVGILYNHGVDPLARTHGNPARTALHIACTRPKPDLLRRLLEHPQAGAMLAATCGSGEWTDDAVTPRQTLKTWWDPNRDVAARSGHALNGTPVVTLEDMLKIIDDAAEAAQ